MFVYFSVFVKISEGEMKALVAHNGRNVRQWLMNWFDSVLKGVCSKFWSVLRRRRSCTDLEQRKMEEVSSCLAKVHYSKCIYAFDIWSCLKNDNWLIIITRNYTYTSHSDKNTQSLKTVNKQYTYKCNDQLVELIAVIVQHSSYMLQSFD